MGGRLILALAGVLAGCGSTSHSVCPAPPNDVDQPALLGVMPDATSAFHSGKRVTIHASGDLAAIIERAGERAELGDGGVDRTDWLASAQLLLRGSAGVPGRTPARATAYVGATEAVSSLPLGEPHSTRRALQAGVGVSLVTDVAESHFRGLALRLDGSREIDDADPPLDGGADPFVSLRPLDVMRIGRGSYLQGMVELRYELMGCYAPFLHVGAGVRKGDADDDAHARVAVPVSVYLGAHRQIGGDPVMIYGGIDTHILHPHASATFVNRLRFGAETMEPIDDTDLRLGVAADVVLGEVNGAYGSLTMTWGVW